MGASSDERVPEEIDMDWLNDTSSGEDEEFSELTAKDLGEDFLQKFCKEASKLYFDEYGLISHQIDSYNDFIKHGVQRVFDSFPELTVEPGFDPSKKGESEWRYASVRFGKVTIDRPTFWGSEKDKEHNFLPRHARLQNMSYSSRMKIEVHVEVYTQSMKRSDKFKTGAEQFLDKEIKSSETKSVMIGSIPVMIKSDLCWMKDAEKGECEFDHGGYFIVKGAEKAFIAQEQVCKKRLWISSHQDLAVSYQSETKRNRLKIMLTPAETEDSKGEKVLMVYFMSIQIPLWTLFFALGVASDKEVIELIDYTTEDARISNILFASIHAADSECDNFRRPMEALKYVDKMLKGTQFPPQESAEECLDMFVFPNLRGSKRKARFLGYMVKCLLEAFTGRRKCNNKDDFKNKRLDLASELLERELWAHVSHARKRMAKALQRDLYGDKGLRQIELYLDASIVTNGLARAFSIGAWCHPWKKNERISGVVLNVGRANPLQTMAELRKTRQHVNYTGKVGDARYPHPSHWGKVCILTTPDGENCGLIKNLAITGLVSLNMMDVEPLIPNLCQSGMEKLVDDTSTPILGKEKVFLNGNWVGVCENSNAFVTDLRKKRRRKELPQQMEIKRDHIHREIRLYTDAGRIMRPLLVVENLYKIKQFKEEKNKKITFQSLLDKGIIELIGAEEEEDCQTAWGVKYLFIEKEDGRATKYTHCELDLSFVLGLSAAMIPFANHDHARRVLYQGQKHSQQAIGFPTTNPDIRVDTLTHQLHYPQRPLFRTMASDCLGKPGYSASDNGYIPRYECFNGQNAIVAVNVHLGYNQEDSIVMNRASLERGMFRSEHIRSYKTEVDNAESTDKRRKPDECINFAKTSSKIGRVDNLDDDGLPFVGASLQTGDIIIGKCAESGVDHSIKLKHTERGMVQKVVLSSNDDGKNFAVVSLRQVRSPILGDKFSSMHGQKGVLGYLESQENFPFTVQGIVPDVVINPHAFPSRQTPGQLLESALGKGIALAKGTPLKHATPFSTPSVAAITEQLHNAGFQRWGNERVYNGRTGEMVKSLIFMGPNFYQRLVHMSEDKVKFRNTGPVHPLTRQPVADRKRFGGVKFGEMERDCLLAHGASANLHERLFTLSDCSQINVCRKCDNVASVVQRAVSGGHKIRGPFCRICESGEDIVNVSVPYGAKLLYQELFAMGINLTFSTRLC